jgi:hypothetical protein
MSVLIQCLYVFTDITHFTVTIFPRIVEDRRKYHFLLSPACYSIDDVVRE